MKLGQSHSPLHQWNTSNSKNVPGAIFQPRNDICCKLEMDRFHSLFFIYWGSCAKCTDRICRKLASLFKNCLHVKGKRYCSSSFVDHLTIAASYPFLNCLQDVKVHSSCMYDGQYCYRIYWRWYSI